LSQKRAFLALIIWWMKVDCKMFQNNPLRNKKQIKPAEKTKNAN
jgi:hypothetical protein